MYENDINGILKLMMKNIQWQYASNGVINQYGVMAILIKYVCLMVAA